jgi:hypothetical protein
MDYVPVRNGWHRLHGRNDCVELVLVPYLGFHTVAKGLPLHCELKIFGNVFRSSISSKSCKCPIANNILDDPREC